MMQRILSGGKAIIPQINKFPQKSQQCRKLSGHGHGAGAHHGPVGNKLDPYPMKHHQTQPNEAYLFGIKPGDKLEGWEIPVYGVYFICTIICVVGIGYCKDDDSLTVRTQEHSSYCVFLYYCYFNLSCWLCNNDNEQTCNSTIIHPINRI